MPKILFKHLIVLWYSRVLLKLKKEEYLMIEMLYIDKWSFVY